MIDDRYRYSYHMYVYICFFSLNSYLMCAIILHSCVEGTQRSDLRMHR